VFCYYGFDFRNYAPASLKRRIWNTICSEQLNSVSGLQEYPRSRLYERFLLSLSVNVTGMFRDPDFFLTFRSKRAATYELIRIWHAGCSTGEEVYSIAILLQEEGLYHRCRIYATDMNEVVLKSQSWYFPTGSMQYTQHYLKAGGKQSFLSIALPLMTTPFFARP